MPDENYFSKTSLGTVAVIALGQPARVERQVCDARPANLPGASR